MNPLIELQKLGQSIWYDNMRRSLLQSGGLAKMIAQGVRGMTSNPTIFEKAIGESNDYDGRPSASLSSATSFCRPTCTRKKMAVADIPSQRPTPCRLALRPREQGKDGLVCAGGIAPKLASQHRCHGSGEASVCGNGWRGAERDDQGAGHAGGHARHPAAAWRRHQRQRDTDVLDGNVRAGLRSLHSRPGEARKQGQGRDTYRFGGQSVRQPRGHGSRHVARTERRAAGILW